MNTNEVVLRLNPVPWKAPELALGYKNGKPYPMAHASAEVSTYQNAVRELVGQMDLSRPLAPYDLTFYFWRQTELGTNTGTGRRARKHPADATNMQKALEDALQGVLIDNDRDVHHVCSWLIDQGPEVTPLIVISLRTCSCAFKQKHPYADDLVSLIEKDQPVARPDARLDAEEIF